MTTNNKLIFDENELPLEFVQASHDNQLIIIRHGIESLNRGSKLHQICNNKHSLIEWDNGSITELEKLQANRVIELLKIEITTLQNKLQQQIENQIVSIQEGVLVKTCQLQIENIELRQNKEQYDKIQLALQKSEDELAKLRQERQTKTSKAIGNDGEYEVESLLHKYVVYDFTNTSLQHHKGDFNMTAFTSKGKKINILIDAKKFSKLVSTTDREKLFYDVDYNDDVDCGVMISLESDIAAASHMMIQETQKQKPIIYIILKNMTDELRGHEVKAAINIIVKIVELKQTENGEINWLANYTAFYNEIDKHRKGLEKVKRAQTKMLDEQIIELSKILGEFTIKTNSANNEIRNTNEEEIEIDTDKQNCAQISVASEHIKKNKRKIISDTNRCTAKYLSGKQCQNKKMHDDLCQRHYKQQQIAKNNSENNENIS